MEEPKLEGSEADARRGVEQAIRIQKQLRAEQLKTFKYLHMKKHLQLFRLRMMRQHQQEQIPMKEQLRAEELKNKSDLGRIQAR